MARRLSDVMIVNKNLTTTHFDSYDFTSGKSTPDVTSSGRLPVGFVIFEFDQISHASYLDRAFSGSLLSFSRLFLLVILLKNSFTGGPHRHLIY